MLDGILQTRLFLFSYHMRVWKFAILEATENSPTARQKKGAYLEEART